MQRAWQVQVKNIFPKLKYNLNNDKHRRLRNAEGPAGRIKKIQKTLTALLKYERLEVNYNRADETRGYVELVSIFYFCLHLPFFLIITFTLI